MPKSTNPIAAAYRGIGNTAWFFWSWSVPYKSRNGPEDEVYASVWRTPTDVDSSLRALQEAFPDIDREKLPTDEESIRLLIRQRLYSTRTGDEIIAATSDSSDFDQVSEKGKSEKAAWEKTEEAWDSVPITLRYLLASANAGHLEAKLRLLESESFHPKAGRGSILRSISGVEKTFGMWRNGFKAAVPRKERYFTNFFFMFLFVCACYPDVAAGFLGERSYNQRSIGMRIVTLCQLYFIWTYEFHSLWLLFNWSLERLLGAFVGNTIYALAAVIPALHAAYLQSWFRTMMLIVSLCWQITIQFYPAARDYAVRWITRHQAKALRRQAEQCNTSWKDIDLSIKNELVTLEEFNSQSGVGKISSWQEVPMRVRIERYIQFTACFKLGRPADQLVGLVKDDFESIINTYLDYNSTAPGDDTQAGQGHVELRLPKFLLVAFDVAIFAYSCYSFYPQPFTFNTVVAYGTVVTIKQTILALKRFQTPKSARRLFTNMAAVNIIGMLLVSTPVTVDKHILEDDGKFIALTLAMTFATLFLAEPIAPVLLALTDKLIAGVGWVGDFARSKTPKASSRADFSGHHVGC